MPHFAKNEYLVRRDRVAAHLRYSVPENEVRLAIISELRNYYAFYFDLDTSGVQQPCIAQGPFENMQTLRGRKPTVNNENCLF